MAKDKQYGGLDAFKLIAALLVICIHTSPLTTFSANADFFLTRIAARIAVPFFLMVSGFFILPQYLFERGRDSRPLMRFLKKTAFLYAVAIIIYLPINLYAGQFKGLDVTDVIRMILFDGTFYHLWYLPAVILGALIVFLLSRKLPFQAVMFVSLFLYGIGLMGDSYFGAISGVPVLSTAYDAMFHVFSYTRNGLFYAPIFLAMGAWLGHSPRTRNVKVSTAGFALSMTLMTVEGFFLHYLGWQRHDSMYLLTALSNAIRTLGM